jgi:hypothetical protein
MAVPVIHAVIVASADATVKTLPSKIYLPIQLSPNVPVTTHSPKPKIAEALQSVQLHNLIQNVTTSGAYS